MQFFLVDKENITLFAGKCFISNCDACCPTQHLHDLNIPVPVQWKLKMLYAFCPGNKAFHRKTWRAVTPCLI